VKDAAQARRLLAIAAVSGCDQESAGLGTYCTGVLRRHGRGHENLTASPKWRLMPRHLQHIAASRPLGGDTFWVGQLDHQVLCLDLDPGNMAVDEDCVLNLRGLLEVVSNKKRRGRTRKMQELTTDHLHFVLLTVLRIQPLSRPASVRWPERGAWPCSHGRKYPAQQSSTSPNAKTARSPARTSHLTRSATFALAQRVRSSPRPVRS